MQSTLGGELAAILGLPFISLDKIHWRPGWQEATHEQFRDTVREFLLQHESGWIIDGNYNSALGNMLDTKATDTICKDQLFRVLLLVLFFPDILLVHHPIYRSCRRHVFSISSLVLSALCRLNWYYQSLVHRARPTPCVVLSPDLRPHVPPSTQARPAVQPRMRGIYTRSLLLTR